MATVTWGPLLKPGDPTWSDGYVIGGKISPRPRRDSPENKDTTGTPSPEPRQESSGEIETDDFDFTGTLMGGPNIDLVEFSGLQLTDEETDLLWGSTNPRDLLLDYSLCEETEIEESDDIPGMSDSLYGYRWIGDEAVVSQELRGIILAILKEDKVNIPA